MSALNDSRNTSSSYVDARCEREGLLCAASLSGQQRRGSAYYDHVDAQRSDVEGFSVEHQLHTLQQVAERHERQIAALSTDGHHHCEHLVTVYQQLEQVLEKFQLPSLSAAEKMATLQSSMGLRPADAYPSAAASLARAEEKLNEVLRSHRDQVYDVLLDFRQQVDRCDRDSKRRLEAVERSLAVVQGEVQRLQQLLGAAEEARQATEQRLREEVAVVVRQRQMERTALTTSTTEHVTRVQQCCDTLSASVTQLSDEIRAIKRQLQKREKEVDRQLRSVVATEQQVAEVLKQQSRSITRLETHDSLEGAFHEVKDWLGDLEKRMVSRGELLQWTESLKQEMGTLRRMMHPVSEAGATATAADGASTPRPVAA